MARLARRPLPIAMALGLALCCMAASARADDDPFGPSKRPPGAPAKVAEDAPPALEALRPWLAHADWVCRALAARELARRTDDGTVALLATTLAREDEGLVLGMVLKSLAGRMRDDLLAEGGPGLADRTVALLRHAHPVVAKRALEVAKVLPPIALGDDAARYADWWARGRAGFAVECDLAKERRRAAREAAHLRPAPGETVTSAAPSELRRYTELDRIHREGLELVVCLDQTGSMEDVIGAAKAGIVDLIRRMRRLAPKFRVGLVTYDDAAYARFALLSDEAYVEREFRKIGAGGGGDMEEGVDKAIATALRQEKMAWSRAAVRVVVVVGDAPPHDGDVEPLLRAIDRARQDDRYEVPVRIDTVSTCDSGDTDRDGYVPHFRDIARHGGGTGVLLGGTRNLVMELMVASFGPAWREPIRDLLAETAAFDAAAAPKKPAR